MPLDVSLTSKILCPRVAYLTGVALSLSLNTCVDTAFDASRTFFHKNRFPGITSSKSTIRAAVENLLQKDFPKLERSFNRTIKGGCSARKPDIFVDALTHVMFGEVDEDGHNTKEYCI